jgi:hypothetical protein
MEGAAIATNITVKPEAIRAFCYLPNHSTTTKAYIFDIAFVLIKPPNTAQIAGK